MATTTQVRNWWADRRCSAGAAHNLAGHTVRLQPECFDAGDALIAALQAHGYGLVEVLGSRRVCPTGISGHTCQPTGSWCSLHNYDLALDFDFFTYGNPHLHRRFDPANDWALTKFTAAQVAAGEAIRTNNGKQVWKWLGWSIGDTMHWQVNCSPADLATGIDWLTVPNYTGDDEMALKIGDQGNAVAKFQKALKAANRTITSIDGVFGPETEAAVKSYQHAANIAETGMIDGVTGALLMEYVRDVVDPDPSSGTTVDNTAREAADVAQQTADSALARLDAIGEAASG